MEKTVFYREFLDVAECFDNDQQLSFLKIVLKYGLGEKIDVPPEFKAPFIPIKAIIDKSNKKYEDLCNKRKEAGKAGAQKRWNMFSDEENKVFAEIVLMWNDLGITQIKQLTQERKEKLKSIIEKFSIKDIQDTINNIKFSDFLKGKNDKGWLISFDWLIDNETNFTKVFENQFKNNTITDKNINEIWK